LLPPIHHGQAVIAELGNKHPLLLRINRHPQHAAFICDPHVMAADRASTTSS
jgi:hypothetical protein